MEPRRLVVFMFVVCVMCAATSGYFYFRSEKKAQELMAKTWKPNCDFCENASAFCDEICGLPISTQCPELCNVTSFPYRVGCPSFLRNSTYCVVLNGCADCFLAVDTYFDYACQQLDIYEEAVDSRKVACIYLTLFIFTVTIAYALFVVTGIVFRRSCQIYFQVPDQ